MFTQKCIIKKKYEKEFLNNLKRIGYSIADLGGDEFDCEYVLTMYPYSTIDFLWSNHGHDDVVNNGVIDCGTNEELFLAIAALRDDSDNMQWFTDGEYWNLCKEDDWSINEHRWTPNIYFHKATVSELIEYFNK